ncbi:MAG: hydrogenase maturation protease [Verrucomicrobiae bacterium]|nr:hydrogenase maturation protease [Verrucomicrobiae bacterium]
MKTLIIGFGNNSRRDDGVGWYVVDRLRHCGLEQVDLMTTHQLEVGLAETIRYYDMVIFVDAATQDAPRAIDRRQVQPSYQSHAVAHYLTPSDLLALSQTLYHTAPHGLLFSIRGEDFDFGETLSPTVRECADKVVTEICQLVRMFAQSKGDPVHA